VASSDRGPDFRWGLGGVLGFAWLPNYASFSDYLEKMFQLNLKKCIKLDILFEYIIIRK
jgi:hypothetical protein